MKLWKFVLIATALVLSTSVNAALISSNWQTVGDGFITQDTESGLSWLDLSITYSMSYNQVSSQLGIGGEFEGFRYATTEEVLALWNDNLNIDLSASRLSTTEFGPADPELATATLFFGDTIQDNPYFIGYGLVGITGTASTNPMGAYHCNGQPSTDCHDAIGSYYDVTSGQSWYHTAVNNPEHDDSTDPFFGSYLVQTSVVPIPTAAWLFSSGLISLMVLARRKKA